MRGLEPPRAFAHTDLNRARLPVPPHPRAARNRSGAGAGALTPRAVVVLFDDRQVREVALDARGEIVLGVALDDGERGSAPATRAARAALDAEFGRQPGPFGDDDQEDGAGEQQEREDAHEAILNERARRKAAETCEEAGTSRPPYRAAEPALDDAP
jgi:hypothetical protein